MAININTNVAVPQQTGFGVELPSERLAREIPQPSNVPSTAEQDYFSGVPPQAVPTQEVAPAETPFQGYQFSNEPVEDATLVNSPTPEITPELQGEELIKQQQRANYANTDWDSRAELKQTFGEAIKTPEEGSIWHARDTLVNSATKQDIGYEVKEGKKLPLGTTGLNYIQNSLGLDNKVQAANTLTTSVLSFIQMLPSTKEGGSVSAESDIADFLNLDDNADPETRRNVEKELTPEQGAQFLGKALNERAKASKAVAGMETTTQEQGMFSNEAAGQVALNSAIDAGILSEVINKDGKQVLRLTPKGTELAWNSRGLVNKLAEGSGGRSQIFPVTDTGEYQGVMSKIRKPDRNKPSIAAEKYSTPAEILETKRISGSIPLQIPTAKLTIVGLLAKLARKELESGQAKDEKIAKKSGAARLFNLDGKGAGERKATIALADLERDLKYLSNNFLEGNLRFAQHFEDNSTHRLYNDSTDANLQRSKTQRAVYVPVATPIQVNKATFNGISAQQAKSFWEAVGNGNWDKRAKGNAAEMAFLFGLGHAMAPDTDDKTPMAIMQSVTPEKLFQWADTGKKLLAATRMISDGGKKAVADFAGTAIGEFDINQLPPDLKVVINNLISDPDFNRENFGYRLQGYIDAYNYQQAKQTGGAFTPFVTTAIDMNSAGRAMMAMDIGNLDVLERVGLIWNYIDNELGSTQPFGNPRSFFTEACADTAVSAVFNSSRPEIQKQVTDLFKKYSGDKEFTKSFSKNVLLTTDYGKALQYHIEEARNFWFKYPEFSEEFSSITGLNEVQAIDKINELYGATLRSITDTFQYSLPKDMVRTLQMMGTMFSFKGMMDEIIPLGGNMFIPTGDAVMITNSQGDSKRIEMTKAMFDPIARAAGKKISDIHGKDFHYTPDVGSAAANQIGPLFGQYRESMVLLKTMLAVNGGKKAADMLFLQPVFDNFIVDSQSLAQIMYYANNKAVPEVLKWDIQTSIWEDFSKKLDDSFKELSKIGTIFIDHNSKYYGLFSNIDRDFKYILEQENKPLAKDKQLSDKQKQFKADLEKYGYTYLENRDSNETFNAQLTGSQISSLIKSYMAYKDMKSKAKKWIKDGLDDKRKAQERVNSIARAGMIAFMN